MTILPVVDRELRIGARRPATYWTRTILGLGVCLIWFVVLWFSGKTTPPDQIAQVLFWTVTVLAFVFCFLSGMFLTADCISGEKRDGTLGLLFLTDLESHDIVFGKLAATSLHAFYGLLCVLPSLALCLLLGGVTAGEFWRTTIVLIVTMAMSLTVGLAISVLCREVRQAMLGAMAIMMLLTAIPPLLWWLGQHFASLNGVLTRLLLLLSPAFDLKLAIDTSYSTRGGAGAFWQPVIVQLCFSAGAFLLARSWIPRVWNDEREVAAKMAGTWERRLRYGSFIVQRLRRRLLDSNPFCWLSTRDRVPNLIAWAVVLVLFAVWLVFLAKSFTDTKGKNGICFATAVFMGYGAYVLWKSFVAIEAARRISEDRQAGALELILVTTLDVESMLEGQRRALKRLFLGPGLVVLAMNVVLLGMVVTLDQPKLEAAFSQRSLFVFGIGAVCVAAELSSLSHAGTWIGLKARRMQHAFLGVLGRVMLMPYLGIAFLTISLATGTLINADGMFILLVVWMLIGLAVDAIIGVYCRKLLERLFRTAAAGDFEALVPVQTEEDPDAERSPQPV